MAARLRPSPVTGASTVVNHNTSLGRSVPSAEVQARIDAGEIRMLCMHCAHPPPDGGALRGIPEVGPYKGGARTTGQFCSFECMLGHTLETRTYRSPMQRAVILEMAHDELGAEHITPAGPRTLLAVFNGPYSIEEFRALSRSGKLLRHCAAPFASAMAIAEVYQREGMATAPPTDAAPPPEPEPDDGSMCQLNEWGLRGLKRPASQPDDIVEPPASPPPSFYQDYIDRIDESAGAPAEAEVATVRRSEPRRRPTRSSGPAGPGGLSRFLKPA
jgi:hypothetical protein